MLDKFLALLERFVVAHELIAANSAKQPAFVTVANDTTKPVEIKVEGEDVIDTKPVKKPDPVDDDLADEESQEEKPKRAPRKGKVKEDAPEVDLTKIKDELVQMAQHIGSGDSDECDNEFQDLLDEYDVRSVKKLPDDKLEKFHRELKDIVAKYYDVEED